MSDKAGKESQYMVSRPELGSDMPIGSDRESGCDTNTHYNPMFDLIFSNVFMLNKCPNALHVNIYD